MPLQGPASLKFARGVSNVLLDAAREVALAAAGGDLDAARLISKGQFDQAREVAGYPEMITAERLRQKLRAPHWHGVLAIVFLEPERRAGAIGSYQKRVSALGQGADLPTLQATPVERKVISDVLSELMPQDAPVPTKRKSPTIVPGTVHVPPGIVSIVVTRALRSVAFRLSHTPSGVAYDDMIRRMEHERAQAGLPPLGFPDSKTIITRLGSWKAAYESAGLEPPPDNKRHPGLRVVDVLDEYIEREGIVPGFECFRAWTAACDLSVEHRRTDSWDVIVAETRAKRAERGAQTPAEIARRKRDWPAMPSPEEAAAVKAKLGGPPRLRRRRPPEEAFEGIRIYAREHLRPGERPSQRHYLAACKRDPRLVWPSKLPKLIGMTFTELCAREGL